MSNPALDRLVEQVKEKIRDISNSSLDMDDKIEALEELELFISEQLDEVCGVQSSGADTDDALDLYN